MQAPIYLLPHSRYESASYPSCLTKLPSRRPIIRKPPALPSILSRGTPRSMISNCMEAASGTISAIVQRSPHFTPPLIRNSPFVQRIWIALEAKGLPYQYIEVDPYKKPAHLLAINPRGLVPALRHGDWGCYESTVLMEYLEDLHSGISLFPSDPRGRAHCRLWADHINRHIVPSFYPILQSQTVEEQATNTATLKTQLQTLINAAHPDGPFFLGDSLSFTDCQIAPWIIRLRRVLGPYRGWPDPEEGSRWKKWVDAIEDCEAVRATTSGDELYIDSYERYAENRPDTSQVAQAVNEGRGLP